MDDIFVLENSSYLSVNSKRYGDESIGMMSHKQAAANNDYTKDIQVVERSRPEVMYTLAGFSVSLPLISLLILYLYYKGYCKRRRRTQPRLETSSSIHEINRISMYMGDDLDPCPVKTEEGITNSNEGNEVTDTISLSLSNNGIEDNSSTVPICNPNDFEGYDNGAIVNIVPQNEFHQTSSASDCDSIVSSESMKVESMNHDEGVTIDSSLNGQNSLEESSLIENDVSSNSSSIIQQGIHDNVEQSNSEGFSLSNDELDGNTLQMDSQMAIEIQHEENSLTTEHNANVMLKCEKDPLECSSMSEGHMQSAHNEATEMCSNNDEIYSDSEKCSDLKNVEDEQNVNMAYITSEEDPYVPMMSPKSIIEDQTAVLHHYVTINSQKSQNGEYKIESEQVVNEKEYVETSSHTILNPQLSVLEDYVTMYPYASQMSNEEEDYEEMDGVIPEEEVSSLNSTNESVNYLCRMDESHFSNIASPRDHDETDNKSCSIKSEENTTSETPDNVEGIPSQQNEKETSFNKN